MTRPTSVRFRLDERDVIRLAVKELGETPLGEEQAEDVVRATLLDMHRRQRGIYNGVRAKGRKAVKWSDFMEEIVARFQSSLGQGGE